MKNKTTIILINSLAVFILFTCHASLPAAVPEKAAHPTPESRIHRGNVIATMGSGGYTYIEFEEEGKRLWVACRETVVKVGDKITFVRPLVMKNFHSKTLNRTFETILFAGSIKVEGDAGSSSGQPGLPPGHPAVGPKPGDNVTVTPGSVKKAEGGYTVAQCYAMKKDLKGKEVIVRGRVVKISSGIMGKNWVHIKDGTGEKGSDDLTVTTTENVRIGDLILVKGVIACDKNFGAGYFYPVLVEGASVSVE